MQFLSVSADMIFKYRFQYRYRPVRKSKISVVIGISRYEKKLIGCSLLEGDEDFRYDYEAMFRWFHKEKLYNRCAPKNAKPFQLVEERQYQMGTVVEVSSEEDPDHEGKYNLDEKSKLAVKTEFARLLSIKRPVVLFLASCFSHKSEISDLLKSVGLFAVMNVLEERGNITVGKLFRLDPEQQTFFRKILDEKLNIKDIILGG